MQADVRQNFIMKTAGVYNSFKFKIINFDLSYYYDTRMLKNLR